MEALNKIALAQQPTGSGLIKKTSQMPLDDAMEVATLLAQAKAFKPNQVLPSADLTLQAWEELAQEYGINRFRESLWRVLRSSPFFPSPSEIALACDAIRREASAARDAKDTAAFLAAEAELAKDRREHPEKYVTMASIFAEYEAKRGGREVAVAPAQAAPIDETAEPLVPQEVLDRMAKVKSELIYGEKAVQA